MALLTVYVDHAAADTTGDGSVGDPWKYIYQATGAIKTDAGTNQYKVWIKASATYGTDENAGTSLESDDAGHDGAGGDAGAVMFVDQVGGNALPNVFEGYKTSVDDGGIVKIDCQGVTNQLTNGIITLIGAATYNVFKNFQVTRASGDGFSCNGDTDDNTAFKNCLAYLNGGQGFTGDNYISCICCQAEGNTGYGFDFDSGPMLIACIAHGNSIGIFGGDVHAYNCLAYNNSSHDYNTSSTSPALLAGCTADGENAAGDYCVHQDNFASNMLAVVNCILHDGDYGIYSDGNAGELSISRHNLFNSSGTADVNNWLATSTGDGTGNRGDVVDPGTNPFNDEGARDYSAAASAQNLAIDAYFTQQFWADYNKGAGDNPPAE